MNAQDRRSRVAWPGVSRGGGELDDENSKKIRELVDDFGIALEQEAITAGLNVFAFPLFREFNLIAALAANQVLLAIAPSSGLPTQSWLDWQAKSPAPTMRDLTAAVQEQLGWEPVSTLSFSRVLLDQDSATRLPSLHGIAKQWVGRVIQEAERQARIVRMSPIFRGRDFLMEEDLCFVLMPFREPFLRLYNDQIKPALERLGLRVIRADDLFTPTAIVEDIWEYINRARLIVADVTGRNPNVFYELGVAHTVGKEVIVLTQNEDDIPFDLRHLRYFGYIDNQEGWEILRSNLEKATRAVLGK